MLMQSYNQTPSCTRCICSNAYVLPDSNNCLYIGNTKVINLREEDEGLSPFLHCLSNPPMLFGGFAPPAAKQTSAVFFIDFSQRRCCTSNWNWRQNTPKKEKKNSASAGLVFISHN